MYENKDSVSALTETVAAVLIQAPRSKPAKSPIQSQDKHSMMMLFEANAP